jgi:hypothetical protein
MDTIDTTAPTSIGLDSKTIPRYLDSAESTIAASFEQSDGSVASKAIRLNDGTPEADILAQWMLDPANRPVAYANAKTFEDYKTATMVQIDLEAERARLQFITPGAGMAAVYLAKFDEARQFQADPNPDPNEYPILASSVGSGDGSTIAEVAATVIGLQRQWRSIAGYIEGTRLKAKAAIKAASTLPEVQAIRKGLVWPKP